MKNNIFYFFEFIQNFESVIPGIAAVEKGLRRAAATA